MEPAGKDRRPGPWTALLLGTAVLSLAIVPATLVPFVVCDCCHGVSVHSWETAIDRIETRDCIHCAKGRVTLFKKLRLTSDPRLIHQCFPREG